MYDQRDNHDEQTKLLPTQSPDLAHGWILACFGWRMLREDRTPAPPQNPVEATTQEFHEAMRARVKDYTDGLARSEMEETEDWGGGMY